jgi:hypothetical protein
MRRVTTGVGALALGLTLTAPVHGQPLQYWGRQPHALTGWVELGNENFHEIGVGSELPGWGRIREVHDDRLIVEQVRTDSEKQRLQEQGAAVYDVLEIHLLRQDLRYPQLAIPRHLRGR